MKKRSSKKPKAVKPDLHDCAKGQMHDAFAQKVVRTMPGGFIA
jgi:hypothetical protein